MVGLTRCGARRAGLSQDMHLRFRLRTIMHTPRPTGDRGDMTGDDKESFKVRPRLAALHPTSQARTWRLALERRAASAQWQWGSGQSGPECHCALRCAPGTRCPLEARGCARSLLA